MSLINELISGEFNWLLGEPEQKLGAKDGGEKHEHEWKLSAAGFHTVCLNCYKVERIASKSKEA